MCSGICVICSLCYSVSYPRQGPGSAFVLSFVIYNHCVKMIVFYVFLFTVFALGTRHARKFDAVLAFVLYIISWLCRYARDIMLYVTMFHVLDRGKTRISSYFLLCVIFFCSSLSRSLCYVISVIVLCCILRCLCHFNLHLSGLSFITFVLLCLQDLYALSL